MVELALLAALVAGQTDAADEVDDVEAAELAPIASPREDPTGANSYDYAFANTHLTPVGDGPTKVTVTDRFATPNYGYFPLVVHVDNTLGPRQTLKLTFSSTGSGGSHQFTRSVEVGQGERRVVSLPVPSHVRYGAFRVRGPGISDRGEAHISFTQVNLHQRAVLNLGTAETFQATTGSKPSFSGSATVQVVTLGIDEAPSETASYVGWDTVVLSGAKVEQLSDAQRRALEAYAALGGHLVLMQGARGLASSFPLLASDSPQYGVGRLTFCQGCSEAQLLAHEARVPVRAIEPKGRRNRYAYEPEPANELKLPVATAPIGRFVLIIALFTLAIGPGSLWVARKKGPAALLVTIPGTAAITCALIVGYSALRDGFTVHSTVQGFTLLDAANHRAITAGVGAFYANLAPGSARFGNGELVVAPTTTREYGGVEQTASINWDEGLKVGADFIPSRSYLEWSFLSSAPTRARVVVKASGGGAPRVQNALGSDLDYLQLRTSQGVFSVTSLKDGEEKAATEQKVEAPVQLVSLKPRLSAEARAALTAPLRVNEFIAAMSTPGLVPMGGLSLELSDSRHLVRGGFER
ncbi:MAG: hypothetical protein IPJ65_11475 [Archangiaceae bacterium]|nr:hypothetical protein [Archangiaceae bacterium]